MTEFGGRPPLAERADTRLPAAESGYHGLAAKDADANEVVR
ncbi:hypothetical protein [Streptomyces sp. NPDC005538]